jgi:hypothetical protein
MPGPLILATVLSESTVNPIEWWTMIKLGYLVRFTIALIILPIFSIMLLVTVSLIPSSTIVNGLSNSFSNGTMALENYTTNRDNGAVFDNYSECIALGMGVGSTNQTSLEATVQGYKIGSCKDIALLFGLKSNYEYRNPGISEDSSWEPNPYSRFWHGYQIVLRPALALGGVQFANFVGFTILVFAVYFISFQLSRIKKFSGPIFAASLFLALDSSQLWSAPAQSIGLAMMLFSGGIALRYWDSKISKQFLSLFIAGFAANYFSMLFNQALWIAILMVPLVLNVWGFGRIVTLRDIQRQSTIFIAWISGFIYGFVSRNTIRILWDSPQNIVSDLKSTITYRTQILGISNVESIDAAQVSHRAMFEQNIETFLLSGPRAYIILVLILLAVLFRCSMRIYFISMLNSIFAISLATCLGLLLFFQHSLNHYFYTWRNLAVAISIIVVATIFPVLDLFDRKKESVQ